MTFKQRIQNIIFPLGTIQKIRAGYLKGCRIKLSQNSLWSPLIGNWEPAMQKIMANVIKPGQVVYDLGANNGLHGLLMAPIIGLKGMLYNFEPFEENIQEIVVNYELNNISNYRNILAAVSDKNGKESFVIGEHHKQGHLFAEKDTNSKKIVIECITLDNFIEEGNPGPSFIKMDIEGAEGRALKGFAKGIKKFLPLIIIELHNPEQDREVGTFLFENGYTAYRFDTFKKLKFTLVRDYSKTYPSPEGVWGSIFCVPPGKKVEDFTFGR